MLHKHDDFPPKNQAMLTIRLGPMADSRLYKIAHWLARFTGESAVPGCQKPEQDLLLRCLDAASFGRSAIASRTVVINCAVKMMVEFFSTEIFAIVWRVRS
jgi:hypothetical protein